jgi:hypothetical protein
MTMATKQEIFREKLKEYLAASRQGKGVILDAVCGTAGVHRKAAIRRFRTLQLRPHVQAARSGRKRLYGPEFAAALRELWEMSGRICAERLRPILPEYVRVLRRDGMWTHGEEATALLFRASLGTLKTRVALFGGGGRRGRAWGTTKPSDLKEVIPIRRGPWKNPPAGWGEIDTVAHCGFTLAGDFAYTVQYTDVATVWTCLAAQWNKGQTETRKSIEGFAGRLPFPLRGLDPDSGSEFINWHLKGWCDAHGISMTRTRPYMKNDHARIEQKNYVNVRRVVGYSRFDRSEHVAVLNELYEALEDSINFFTPSLVCDGKERVGSKMIRRYREARTAYRRTLERSDVPEDVKEALRRKYATLNPKTLRKKCDRLVRKLLAIRPRLR